ncbi:calcium-binding protein [Ramlibacter sp. PS3R-8]|uniref:calcium-binding protein n=1 Tax=Ramlibacter sp. PS3R-8 TaxID=3133437 RepID=UPI0030B42CFA
MTIRKVGPNSTYPTIAAAVDASAAGDIIRLETRYSNERAVLTVEDLTVMGGPTSRNIELVLGVEINDVTLDGLADIRVLDNTDSNIITGNGGDTSVWVSGGADVVHGGDGRDRLVIDYRGAVTSVVATAGSVTHGETNSVTFDGFEDLTISGGSAPDNLTVGDGDHWLNSGGGNDTVTAGAGYTDIKTEGGDDTITAVGGVVYSGPGNDTISITDGGSVSAGSGNDTVTTGDGDTFVGGEEGDDTVTTGGGDDFVDGGEGDDFVRAGAGDDTLMGSYGADTLSGGRGADRLIGERGKDVLNGSLDNDTLIGGRDKDVLNGGRGADVFRFDDLDSLLGATDLIGDLNEVEDTIDLSRIDADVTAAGDQSFVLVGRFSGTAGEANLRYVAADDVTRLTMDTDGDGAANIAIVAAGDHRTFDSFVL